MPLSEEELRLLEQMERALVEEDPKLASTLRGTTLRSAARRRAIVAGVVLRRRHRRPDDRCHLRDYPVGIAGFVIMLASATFGADRAPRPATRRHRARRRRLPATRPRLHPDPRRRPAAAPRGRSRSLRLLHGAHGGALAAAPRRTAASEPRSRDDLTGLSTTSRDSCPVASLAQPVSPRAALDAVAWRGSAHVVHDAAVPTVSGSARVPAHRAPATSTDRGHQSARRRAARVAPPCRDATQVARSSSQPARSACWPAAGVAQPLDAQHDPVQRLDRDRARCRAPCAGRSGVSARRARRSSRPARSRVSRGDRPPARARRRSIAVSRSSAQAASGPAPTRPRVRRRRRRDRQRAAARREQEPPPAPRTGSHGNPRLRPSPPRRRPGGVLAGALGAPPRLGQHLAGRGWPGPLGAVRIGRAAGWCSRARSLGPARRRGLEPDPARAREEQLGPGVQVPGAVLPGLRPDLLGARGSRPRPGPGCRGSGPSPPSPRRTARSSRSARPCPR